MKEKIEKFLEKRLNDLEKDFKNDDYDELILNDNFALWTMLDEDEDGGFVFIELLGKDEDDFHYEDIMISMTLDSVEMIDDYAEYIIKKMNEIMEEEKEYREKLEREKTEA